MLMQIIKRGFKSFLDNRYSDRLFIIGLLIQWFVSPERSPGTRWYKLPRKVNNLIITIQPFSCQWKMLTLEKFCFKSTRDTCCMKYSADNDEVNLSPHSKYIQPYSKYNHLFLHFPFFLFAIRVRREGVVSIRAGIWMMDLWIFAIFKTYASPEPHFTEICAW